MSNKLFQCTDVNTSIAAWLHSGQACGIPYAFHVQELSHSSLPFPVVCKVAKSVLCNWASDERPQLILMACICSQYPPACFHLTDQAAISHITQVAP